MNGKQPSKPSPAGSHQQNGMVLQQAAARCMQGAGFKLPDMHNPAAASSQQPAELVPNPRHLNPMQASRMHSACL